MRLKFVCQTYSQKLAGIHDIVPLGHLMSSLRSYQGADCQKTQNDDVLTYRTQVNGTNPYSNGLAHFAHPRNFQYDYVGGSILPLDFRANFSI